MSGEKYWAKRQDILAAMGPEWSIWDDLPSDPNEVELHPYPCSAIHSHQQ